MRKIFVSLMLILSLTQILPAMAVTEFEERTEPYYWSSKDSIFVHNLIIGEEYAILVGSNQARTEQQWINFTSESSRVKIWFSQDTAEYTNETIKIQQLFLDLYKIDSNFDSNPVYVDRLALNIIYQDEQVDFGNISENLILLFLTFILTIAVGGLFYAITQSKRFKKHYK